MYGGVTLSLTTLAKEIAIIKHNDILQAIYHVDNHHKDATIFTVTALLAKQESNDILHDAHHHVVAKW